MATQTRAAIVTGSSQGIGAAVAERLAADGLAVVVNYSSNADPAKALVEKIKGAGGRAIAIGADVSDPAAVADLFDQAEQAFGGIDVLVNNAGIMKLATIAETDDALFDRTIAINLNGAFIGLREAARRDHVDRDLLGPELLGQDMAHRLDPRLGRGVARVARLVEPHHA